jgi:drug/metabolite transporter (DMT)-like permease
VVSVLLGALFLHEGLTVRVIVGMVVVLVGVGLTRRRPTPVVTPPEPVGTAASGTAT